MSKYAQLSVYYNTKQSDVNYKTVCKYVCITQLNVV